VKGGVGVECGCASVGVKMGVGACMGVGLGVHVSKWMV